MNQFDQNYFKQSGSFGNNFSMGGNQSSFMNNSGRNSRNGLPGNSGNNQVHFYISKVVAQLRSEFRIEIIIQNLSSNGSHMNMRGVIGTNFGDKKFGSVGSKIDQKMVNMDQKGNMRGQVKKNMNKDFLSQVICSQSYDAKILL